MRTISPVLLLAVLLAPMAPASPADDVAWPKDLGEPHAARVANIEAALDIQVDYWYADPESALSSWDETLEHPKKRDLRIASSYTGGALKVVILRQDGTDDGFSVNATRALEEHGSGRGAACPDEPCSTSTKHKIITVDRVHVDDLPIGIRFGADNGISIQGPPAALAHHGEGVDAVRSLAETLGIPVARIDWASAGDSAEAILPGLPPEVEAIACDCTHHWWTLQDSILGAGQIGATLASGKIIAFSASPIVATGYVPAVSVQEAEEIARAHMAREDLDRPIVRNATPGAPPFFLKLIFLDHHGVTWRFQAHAQGPEASAQVEGFIDADTGEVVHASRHDTSTGGYAAPVDRPPLWSILLVVAIALVVIWRYEGRP